MRIFITGATGYIGGTIARLAQDAGHEVAALAHTDSADRQLRSLGYSPVPGSLTDTTALVRHVRSADAVVHAGIATGAYASEVDHLATEAMVGALAGSGRPFIYTSGVWVLGATDATPVDEDSPVAPLPVVAWRGPLEHWLRAAATHRDAHTVIIRPGVAYGSGGGIPGKIARGTLPLVGGGRQRWSVVHVDDLAALYLAAVERAGPGAVLHGVGDVVRLVDLLDAEPVRVDSVSQNVSSARATLGDFADALALDQEVLAHKTRAALGWQPRPAPVAVPATHGVVE
jgi:nucleoside-diphosphate-sugar epimerase